MSSTAPDPAGRIAALRGGHSHVEDVSNDVLREALPHIHATTDVRAAGGLRRGADLRADAADGQPRADLGALEDAGRALAGVLRAGQLVVLESTTYPGTTRERLTPLLAASGLVAGEDFNLAFSAERWTRAARTTRCARRRRSSAG